MRHNLWRRSRKHLAQLFRGRQEHTRRQRGLGRLLELEALEDRTLPSVLFTPSSPTVPIHNPDVAQGGVGGWRPVEPQITVNPKDPANVILTSQNGLEVSTDGGATFGDAVSGTFVAGAALGFPQSEPNGGGDTRTVFDSNGNLFWANLSKVGSNISIYVTQVDPQSGTQIGNTVLVDNPPLEYLSGGTTYQDYDDKVSLAADSNGNLYMAWSRGTSSGWEVLLSKGTNKGQNWSTPVVVSSSSEGFVWPTSVAVDSGGDVFVAYHSEPGDPTTGQVLVARYDENLNFVDKTNPFGGEGTAVRRSSYPTLQWPGGLGTAPAAGPVIIADPTNDSVYVFAVNDPSAGSATGDPADIIYARSTGSALSTSWAYHGTLDSGANSNSSSLEILPTAAIDKYGDIVVAWYDGRNGGSSATSFPSGFTDGLLDVYAKYSTDRGQTWSSAFRVNDSSNRLDLGTSRPMDYFGIDLYGNTAYVAWVGNTRDASGTVTGQQVYTDAFSLKGSLTVTNDLGFPGDNYITIDKLSSSELTIIESGIRTYAGLYEGLTSITVNGSTLGVEVNLLTRLGTFTSVSINTNETAGESSTVDLEQSTIFSTITVSLGSGTDTVDMGTLNHSFAAQFESDEIINGNANGSDTLEIDEGNHNGGSTWTIDDSSLQTNIFQGNVRYSQLKSLKIDGGRGGNTFNVLSTAAGTSTTIDAGSGGDAVMVGDANHNLGDVTNLTVNGTGNTTLEVDDRGTYVPPLSTLVTPGGFERYIPLQTQFTIDAGYLTRSAQALVQLASAPYFTSPSFTTSIQYGGLASLTVDGGPAVVDTSTKYYVRSTQGTNAVILKTSANGSDAVTVGDASHNLGDVTDLTVNGNGITTLEVDDRGTYVPPLSVLGTPGFVSYLPFQTQFTIEAGQLTRSAQAFVNYFFAPYVTFPSFTSTIQYGGLASLTVDGGQAVAVTPTAYHVLSTQGTNAVILKTSANGSDAVTVGDASHNLGDVANLTVNGNGITTLEVDDRGTYVPPLSVLGTPGFVSYLPFQTQFTIEAGQLTRSAQAFVNYFFAPYVTFPSFTSTIQYGALASLTLDGGQAVAVTPTAYHVLSTQGTNAVILKTSANGSDAVTVGDASHNLGDVTSLQLNGNGNTTLEVDDRGTYVPPLSTLVTPGGFASYIPLQTQFTIDAGQLTRSAQALVQLVSAPYFTSPPPFTTTIHYGGLASLTVDGGPAVVDTPTNYYVRSTQGTNAVTIKSNANGSDAVNVGDANNTLNGIQSSLTVEGQGSNTTLNAYDTGTSSQEEYGVSATQIKGNPAIQITRTPSGSDSPTQTIEYTDIGYVNVYGGSGQDLWAVESTSPQTQSTALYSGSGISHNPNEIILENAADVLDDIQGPVAIHGTVYDLVVAYDALNAVGHTYTLTTGLLTRDNGASNISISYDGIGEFIVATANNPYYGHSPNTVKVQSLGTVFAPIAVGTGDTVTVGQNGSMANILGDVRIQNTAGQTPKQITLNDLTDMTSHTVTLGSDPTFGYLVNGLANNSQGRGRIGLDVDPTTPVSIYTGAGTNILSVHDLTNAPALSLVGNTAGTNTLQGPNTANTWKITGPNAGSLDGTVSFTGMQNLLGGAANDAFQFQTGGSLSGTLNGGGGTNTLDYSSYIIDKVIVDLLLGTATGVDGGANYSESNIQNVTGGQGNNLLVGDANPNVLIGGTGRNIIIGGGGSDQITGGGGDNILIGGTTAYDNTTTGLTDLEAIFAVWTDPTLTIGQRSQEIKKGIVVNGQTVALNKSTVFADNAKDSLIGGTGINWFFVDSDDTINNGAGPGPNDTITHV